MNMRKQLLTHFNTHRTTLWPKGARRRVADPPKDDEAPDFPEVFCQRFFLAGPQSSYFAVSAPSSNCQRDKGERLGDQQQALLQPRKEADLIKALVDEELNQDAHNQEQASLKLHNQLTKTESSPWLKMTRWPRYFDGLEPTSVAPLACAANPTTEPALYLITESVNRVVEQVYKSICEDKVNVFDQAKINSFLSSRSERMERIIMVKLQKQTFRAYKSLWKCLLYFAYRTSRPD
ncbi:hypothetical protein SLS57_010234 [Botryosphaeria dothidea]